MKRSPLLKVIDLPEGWAIKTGVPPTRAECEGGKEARLAGLEMCRYVNCRHHLWIVEGRDMPGRRYGTRTPKSEIRPASSATCSLDYTEPLTVQEIAERLGCTPRRVQQLLKAVLARRPDVKEAMERVRKLREFVDS